ncbi:LysR family transcriptional regulator [Luteolibacter pohnpeiensis]|uniref:LysR family transcriptional regulator n=1 Tax=Luteolibacter pohnpeiensis TaxID=454153 RepID=A0A934S7N6_9BACT|nr:LysR family transcriptional regulator [Luteolibacter pohnpeiensis]MBK1880869.1 LysR family transcriptional regulator [Luteolibacter pohnpeiensis]
MQSAHDLLEKVMELRQLRHFLKVGEMGSITAAARELGLTQPALSRQIKALEDDLGTPLLERGAHSVTLTPAGELLLQESKKLLTFSDGLMEKVRIAGMGEPLRIGYAPSLAGDFLAVAIQKFTQSFPTVRVSLSDCSSAEMGAGLVSGRLDLILAPPGIHVSGAIGWETLMEYGWRLVMPGNHPFANKKVISLKDLSGERLLLYNREHYPEYWESVTRFFRERSLQAKVAGEFDGISSLLSALEAGLGVALLAESFPMDRRRGEVIAKPLEEEPERIRVSAGYLSDRPLSPVVTSFVEELKKSAARGT